MPSLLIADACRLPFADGSVELVLGSPLYANKGLRYGDVRIPRMKTEDWVEWMVEVTGEALRVTRDAVVWVVNDPVVGGVHQPAVAGLCWEAWKRFGCNERPLVWHKNSTPNRGDWWGNSHETIVAFRKPGGPRTWNWEPIATPRKYGNGGDFRQRDAKGNRRKGGAYPKGEMARPRDVLYATVGGGHMGHPLAHANEAPYPEKLITPIILALTDPGMTVLDPFLGSGTTVSVALRLGRKSIGCDLRSSQIDLARDRISGTVAATEAATAAG